MGNTILITPMVTDTATTARRKDTEKDILALLVVLEKAIIMAKREDMDMVATMVRRADMEKDGAIPDFPAARVLLALPVVLVLLGPKEMEEIGRPMYAQQVGSIY